MDRTREVVPGMVVCGMEVAELVGAACLRRCLPACGAACLPACGAACLPAVLPVKQPACQARHLTASLPGADEVHFPAL